jgi:hypothetical protein
MGDTPTHKTSQLPRLLIKLNRDEMTGMVTIKDDRRSLRVYLRQGHVASADGLNAESRLIEEIARKKSLSPASVGRLRELLSKDPRSLGRTLVDRGLIKREVWGRFLLFKVKQTLTAAFEMTEAELGFSEGPVEVDPFDAIDYNLFQLLVETVKGIRDGAFFRRSLEGPEAVYEISTGADSLRDRVPLSPSERSVLGLVNGRRTVREIQAAGGAAEPDLYRTLYLLFCLGLIEPRSGAGGEDEVNYDEIAQLYLDLLNIIEANFRKEVGKQFEKVYAESLKELGGRSGALFESLSLSRDAQADFKRQIAARCREEARQGDAALFLKSSFNKLLYLLILRMKKLLGVGLTEKTILEMTNILNYVEKYRQDAEMMNYVKENLGDYLRQVKS